MRQHWDLVYTNGIPNKCYSRKYSLHQRQNIAHRTWRALSSQMVGQIKCNKQEGIFFTNVVPNRMATREEVSLYGNGGNQI